MTARLQLGFITDEDDKVESLSIKDPKTTLDAAEVKNAMDAIISADVLSAAANCTGRKYAKTVYQEITDIDLPA